MKEKNRPKYSKYIIIFWTVFAIPFVTLTLVFILISRGGWGYMPPFEELENPTTDLAAQVISEDNMILGKIFRGNQTRVKTDYDHLSPHLVDALIATEDIRYRRHSGIDIIGLSRAVFYLGKRGGASTITQQLAKQLYTRGGNTFGKRVWQKLNEWVIAVELEKRYTKEEIISMYLNQFDFLNLAVGIQSASKIYFNKTPDSLTVQESATLVGMLKNPSLYNPLRRLEKTQLRRNVVLSQMKKYDYITERQYDSIAAMPLELDFQQVGHNIGYATYFREYLRVTMTRPKPQRKNYSNYSNYKEDSIAWVTDPLYGWCNKNTRPDGSSYDIYSEGLRIHTTINYDLQRYAEWAVEKHLSDYLQPLFNEEKKYERHAPFSSDLKKSERESIMRNAFYRSDRYRKLKKAGVSNDSIEKSFDTPTEMTLFSWEGEIDTVMTPWDSIRYNKFFLHTGLMSMDPKTGHVKAYVGGINQKYFYYDHVTMGKRQAGSLFKPFLYILAMQEGYSPCYEVPVVKRTFTVNDTIWSPKTTTKRKYIGTSKPLKWGLALSDNFMSAWLLKQFSPEAIVDVAYKMGIESKLDPVPSMIYGVSDVTVYEMVGAFSTMANKGVHTKPIFVSRIEDKNGNILASFIPLKEEAISEETAFLMLNLMEGVTNFGTAYRLKSPYFDYQFTSQIAGKTGTTQNHSDGWFVGITPNLVTGVWVGAEDRSVHFKDLALGSGSNMAMPIWGKYMKRVYADSTNGISQTDVFEAPEGISLNLNCDGEDYGSGDSGSNNPYDDDMNFNQ